jgi:hypothetical protein
MALTEETLMGIAQAEIDELMNEAEASAENDGVAITPEMWDNEKELGKLRSPTAKDLVKARMKIIQSIQNQANKATREGAIPFEELGIDMLLVDSMRFTTVSKNHQFPRK